MTRQPRLAPSQAGLMNALPPISITRWRSSARLSIRVERIGR
jgi:hypothetical protein